MKKITYLVGIIAILVSVVGGRASESKCREISRREYPNDASMQQYIYNQQIAADRYMATVRDADVKQIALREYPHD